MSKLSDAIGDVLIGVEFEVELKPEKPEDGGKGRHMVDAHGTDLSIPPVRLEPHHVVALHRQMFDEVGAFDSWGTCQPVVGGGAALMGLWRLKSEYPMGCEFCFIEPTPFREFMPAMEQLFGAFNTMETMGTTARVDSEMGMHVHINVDEMFGACVSKEKLCKAYFGDEGRGSTAYWTGTENLGREDYGYAQKQESIQPGKYADVRDVQTYGTVEMRAWDSTLDWDRIVLRERLLGDLLTSAMVGD